MRADLSAGAEKTEKSDRYRVRSARYLLAHERRLAAEHAGVDLLERVASAVVVTVAGRAVQMRVRYAEFGKRRHYLFGADACRPVKSGEYADQRRLRALGAEDGAFPVSTHIRPASQTAATSLTQASTSPMSIISFGEWQKRIGMEIPPAREPPATVCIDDASVPPYVRTSV